MKTTILFKKLTAFTILSFGIIYLGISQKAPVKFGKIDPTDLQMKVYPADTSASAVILCDYGYFNTRDFSFDRNFRIKILKKEGFQWADQTFPIESKGDIKASTFNFENGQIVETKLKSESIFKEKVTDDIFRLRVAMPNVKEGSVIDFQIRYPSLPSEWRFQDEIPVRWSELVVEPSQYFEFRKNFFGFQGLSESSDMRWVAKDMPAFKKEPYMNSYKNFITKYEFEILNISIPGNEYSTGVYAEYCTTWNKVVGRLMGSNYFGETLAGCAFLNDIVKDIESKCTDPLEKLKAAQGAIKKVVKWNEYESVYTTTNALSYAFNKKIGNSADINLMLTQLLKKLKLDANLVVLSTRENGILPFSPSLDKLNYVVAYVNIGDKSYFADATEEYLPVGLLPERCLNFQGRKILIDEKIQNQISLEPDKKYKEMIQADLKLESDFTLTGKLIKMRQDYAALNFRRNYEKFNSKEEYLKDLENNNKGLTVINCDIQNFDSLYLPVKEYYDVKIKNKVSSTGNLLYITPMLFEQMESNPFTSEERQCPIDFIYPIERTYLFRLTLPKGFEVSEMPKPLIIKMPDNSASILYQVANVSDVLQVTYKFAINKSSFPSTSYAYLRSFFSELVKKQAEPIILKTL